MGLRARRVVLILRTWAIWDGRRGVLLLLAGVLVGITISNCVVVVYYVSHTRGASCFVGPKSRSV